jgi:hypothetical protein
VFVVFWSCGILVIRKIIVTNLIKDKEYWIDPNKPERGLSRRSAKTNYPTDISIDGTGHSNGPGAM